MADTVCLVCGESQSAPYLDILQKCGGCGFVTARLDAPIDARGIYEGDYFTGEEYLDYRADEAFFRKNFRRRLDGLRRRCAGPTVDCPRGRLLEIGAAYGFFLDLARPHFDVIGYEVNPEAVRFARERLGLDVRTDDFLEASPADIGGPVDVTAMWDVIEHLERPDRFIAKIGEFSRPGAMLFVTTGDIGSRLAKWRGRKWRMIHPPSHLHYFDRATLSRLLEKHGFRVIEIRAVGVARSVLQVLYSILVLRLGWKRAYETARKVIPRTAGFTLNTYDIMQVTAQKA